MARPRWYPIGYRATIGVVIDAAVLIRSARCRAGRSLRQLAAAAGTSHSTLASYERGTK
ncbi:MAG: helix-turn-helix domain-containing protein, partial [Ilumatobacteraceae bacterium]